VGVNFRTTAPAPTSGSRQREELTTPPPEAAHPELRKPWIPANHRVEGRPDRLGPGRHRYRRMGEAGAGLDVTGPSAAPPAAGGPHSSCRGRRLSSGRDSCYVPGQAPQRERTGDHAAGPPDLRRIPRRRTSRSRTRSVGQSRSPQRAPLTVVRRTRLGRMIGLAVTPISDRSPLEAAAGTRRSKIVAARAVTARYHYDH